MPTLPPVTPVELRPGATARVRRQAGAAGAPPLVLLSAWPQTLRCWDAHWEGLAASGRELVAVELPGFGRAPLAPRELMRPSAQASLLGELLDRLGLGPVVLVGPDVGVPVALRLAQDAPHHVAALVVFDGPGTARPHLSVEGRLLAGSRAARGLAAVLGAGVVVEMTRRGYSRGRPPAGVVLDHVRSAVGPRRFARQLAFVASYAEELPALADRLGEVRVPVLVLWGAEDPYVGPAEGRALARVLPDARLEEIPGHRHYLHEELGEGFTERVGRWLAEIGAEDRPGALST